MAERQAEHRMDLETRVVKADIRRSNAGLAAGFVVAGSFLVAACVLVISGHEIAGAVIGGIDIVGLVSAFVYGTISRRGERRERVRMMTGES